MAHLTILTPLWIEKQVLRRALPAPSTGSTPTTVHHTGFGARRSNRCVLPGTGPVVVAGVAGALQADLEPGDIVVASAVRSPEGAVVPCPTAGPLVASLRRRGLRVHLGPIVSTNGLTVASARRQLAATGALAVDTESAWLAARCTERPLAVVRTIADTSEHEPWQPSILRAGWRALRALGQTMPSLLEWARAAGPRRVLLAAPRSFCAGVDRAIAAVEQVLDQHGPPVYVRKQIVHNTHVVDRLEKHGAVFVDELDEVPKGSLVVFSAHGVAPSVHAAARTRELTVVDATCPLVDKVHAEARRYARRGWDIVLVGHEGHEETEGIIGEASDRIRLIDRPEDAEKVDLGENVAVLSQTTLAVDEVTEVVKALRDRFPLIETPAAEDICYATQNRQDAVRALAGDSDLLLVIGSQNSSNSKRLVEVAERLGCTARLVEDTTELDPQWLVRAATIGLTAGASAPEHLVQDMLQTLNGFGEISVEERSVTKETLSFSLPKEATWQ